MIRCFYIYLEMAFYFRQRQDFKDRNVQPVLTVKIIASQVLFPDRYVYFNFSSLIYN